MDKQNKLSQNGHIGEFSQPASSRDNPNIARSKSRTERKHHRLKQSRSLEQTKNVAVDQNKSEEDTSGEKGKRHSSEKIRKSSSSKYQSKKLTRQNNQNQHIGNVHRDNTNLQYSYPMFKSGYDCKLDDDNNLNFQTENRQLKDKEKSSASSSLKSSKESNLSAKGSIDTKLKASESKVSSVESDLNSEKHKKLKYSDRNSSASPETSSNELPNSKVRKSRSKRKEIQKTGGCIQPTFYGISGTDLSYPVSTSASNGKNKDSNKRSQTNFNLASTNFAVLETGNFSNERRTGRSLFRRKNCCVLSLLTAVCLLLAGVITTLIILFMTSSVSSDTGRFDMVRAHVRLRILNKEYNDSMRSKDHSSFTYVSEPFCKEVDYVFLTSSLHSEYFGCSTKEIRSGSIRLYYVTPFLDSPQVQNVTKIKNILSGKDNDRVTNTRLDNAAFYLGDFLIDANSIKIEFESYKSESLPKRPKLIVKGLDVTPTFTAQPTSVTQPSSKKRIITYSSTTSTPFSSSTRSVKSATLKRQFTVSTVSRSATAVKSTSKLEKSPVSTMSSPAPLKAFTDSILTTDTGVTPKLTTSTLTKATGTTQHSIQLPAMTTQDFSADMPSTTDYFEYFDDLESTTPLTARLPKIEMTSTDVYLKQRPGHLKCTVRGLKFYSGQISIYYQQTNDTEPKIIVMLVNDGQIYSTIFRDTPENLKISHRSKDYSVTIDLKFEEVTCFDTGLYKCELKSRGKEYTATGSLQGFAIPGKPVLSAPPSLIEGQELSKPITCTADVGYPPGTLRFEIKPRGHTHFFPLQEGTSSTSGPCENNRTITLTYTPTKEANGTLLKCVVENKNIPHIHDVSSVIELQIIAGNICEGHGINKTLRHPFACNKYLLCLGRHFEVHECDNGVCFDQDSGTCGQTSLTMAGVVAYLNEGVTSLKCRLTHTGTWSRITMFKAESSGKRLKIVTSIRGQEPAIHNTSMKDRVFANVEIETRYEVELNVWVYVLTCDDQGDYFCTVDAPFTVPEAKGYVDIRVKPSAPTLSVPNEIIEGLPTRYNFTCEADVGYPHGELVFKMRLHNETDFKALSFVDEIIEEERNCSKVVKRTFQFIPSIVHNGMTVLCEVQNPITLPAGHSMVTSQTIHVVPGNFCHTHEDATPHVHPYDCHQYVQCSENYIYVQRCGNDHCFDPATLRCDAPDPNIKRSFDPNYPCRPNQNGVFFHHPFLCNKYIWCVQGEEIVQHCPIGTLYIDSGQCTFDADQSRCYKTETSKLLA